MALQDGNLKLFADVGLAYSDDDQDGCDRGYDEVDGACNDERQNHSCFLGCHTSNQLISEDAQ